MSGLENISWNYLTSWGDHLRMSSHLVIKDPEQMLDILRHVDAEGVGSLGQEIVRFIRKETV